MQSTSRLIVVLGLMAALVGCSSSDNPVVAETTPTPMPTPEPTPEPTPTPQATGCMVPENPECGGPEGPAGVFGCCREEGTDAHGFEVEAALAVVQQEHADLFQGAEGRVSDVRGLTEAVCEILEANFPLCCVPGNPEDEIAVKETNEFSEQYDIVFGSGFLRNHGYTVTCRPARF